MQHDLRVSSAQLSPELQKGWRTVHRRVIKGPFLRGSEGAQQILAPPLNMGAGRSGDEGQNTWRSPRVYYRSGPVFGTFPHITLLIITTTPAEMCPLLSPLYGKVKDHTQCHTANKQNFNSQLPTDHHHTSRTGRDPRERTEANQFEEICVPFDMKGT